MLSTNFTNKENDIKDLTTKKQLQKQNSLQRNNENAILPGKNLNLNLNSTTIKRNMFMTPNRIPLGGKDANVKTIQQNTIKANGGNLFTTLKKLDKKFISEDEEELLEKEVEQQQVIATETTIETELQKRENNDDWDIEYMPPKQPEIREIPLDYEEINLDLFSNISSSDNKENDNDNDNESLKELINNNHNHNHDELFKLDLSHSSDEEHESKFKRPVIKNNRIHYPIRKVIKNHNNINDNNKNKNPILITINNKLRKTIRLAETPNLIEKKKKNININDTSKMKKMDL